MLRLLPIIFNLITTILQYLVVLYNRISFSEVGDHKVNKSINQFLVRNIGALQRVIQICCSLRPKCRHKSVKHWTAGLNSATMNKPIPFSPSECHTTRHIFYRNLAQVYVHQTVCTVCVVLRCSCNRVLFTVAIVGNNDVQFIFCGRNKFTSLPVNDFTALVQRTRCGKNSIINITSIKTSRANPKVFLRVVQDIFGLPTHACQSNHFVRH